MQPALMSTPLSTSPLHRQHNQTPALSTSSSQQQQMTSVVRGHRRTQSSVSADFQRGHPEPLANNISSIPRVRVEIDRGGSDGGREGGAEYANRRREDIQQRTTFSRPSGRGDMLVATNVGYEPTTLQRQSLQTAVVAAPDNSSTYPRLNGVSDRNQSSVGYGQTTTIERHRVQAPSYATVHRVQQTNGPGSSVFQRAIVVDASELISKEPHQQQTQQMMLTRQQEEEKQRRPAVSQQQPEQRQLQHQSNAAQNYQHQSPDQHQVLMRQRQLAVAQNMASSSSHNPSVNQVGEKDDRRRLTSSSATTTSSTIGRSEIGTTDNGPSRSGDLPPPRLFNASDRHQTGGNFSINSGGFGGPDSRSATISADEYSVRRASLGSRGDSTGPVMRRHVGGGDTSSSASSAASWRSPSTSGGTQRRLSTASSSSATEQSSELGNESSLGRASPFVGERRRYLFVGTFVWLNKYCSQRLDCYTAKTNGNKTTIKMQKRQIYLF